MMIYSRRPTLRREILRELKRISRLDDRFNPNPRSTRFYDAQKLSKRNLRLLRVLYATPKQFHT